MKYCQGGDNDGNPCLINADCPGAPPGNCFENCEGDYRAASCVVYDDLIGAARCYIPRNRYLTIDPTVNQAQVAYHIAVDTAGGLDDQYAECGTLEGWLADPMCLEDDFGFPVDPQPPSTDPCQGDGLFGWVSYVVDGPVTPRQWNEYPLYVTGCRIVPAASYEIHVSPDGVYTFEASLIIPTSHHPVGETQHWGDVCSDPGISIPWMPPEYAMNFGDVAAVIRTFEGAGGPPAPWGDVDINHTINLSDVQFLLIAFEGLTFPELMDITLPDGRPGIGWEVCDCP